MACGARRAAAAPLLACLLTLAAAAEPAPVNDTVVDKSTTIRGEEHGDGVGQHILEALGLSVGCIWVISLVSVLSCTCFGVAWMFKSTKQKREVNSLSRLGMVWSSDPGQMRSLLQQGLDAERYMRIDCISLYLNRPWSKTEGADVSVKTLEHNLDWLEHRPFLGRTHLRGVTPVTLALWRFLFKKKRQSAIPCVIVQAVEGVCPAVAAHLLGSIVWTLNHPEEQYLFYVWVVLFAFVSFLQDRCKYYYEMEVPGASVRQELRQRLQREFLSMAPEEAEVWPPGRCTALLGRDVTLMVKGVWLGFFQWVKHLTQGTSLVLETLYQTREIIGLQICLVVLYGIMCFGAWANSKARVPNMVDMAHRKRDWWCTVDAVASKQLEQKAHGCLRWGTETGDVVEAATFFGNVTMVYRKRAFHFFFVRMMSSLSNTEMVILAQVAIMTILGMEALAGRMSTSGVIGVFSAMNSMRSALASSLNTWLDIVEGYPSTVVIAEVFNRGAGFVTLAESLRQDQGSESDSESDADSNFSDRESLRPGVPESP